MSKYSPLGQYLKQQRDSEVAMTFAQIEALLGTKLPQSAYRYPAWWANEAEGTHVQAKAWLDQGFETSDVDRSAQAIVFRKITTGTPSPAGGFSESPRSFAEANGALRPRRHPLIGSMKGTFTIEPGYDLTSPMYTPEEWAEVEKEMDADWDQIEEGMKRKP